VIHLTDLRCCVCSDATLFAVAPGTEPDGIGERDLFIPPAANADRGVQPRAWCEQCWTAKFSCLQPTTNRSEL
jgi:hypothetical protein